MQQVQQFDMNVFATMVAKAIAQHTKPAVPFEKATWNVEEVAAHIGQASYTVQNKTRFLPDFPAPILPPNTDGSKKKTSNNLHWKAHEIVTWFEKYQVKK